MRGSARVVAAVVAVLALAPPALTAAADVTLVGAPQVPRLVPGQPAVVTVTLKAASKATKPVRLQVKLGSALVGELAAGPLGASQTQTYRIGVTVPAGVAGTAVVSVLAWGEELARQSVSLQAPAAAARPRGSAPSLTQTVATASITLAGNRSATQRPRPPVPSLTQAVATAPITLVGNR